MKVQIEKLEPNPFRDMKNYPINKAKVETLKASMKQTGFWDNILARKHGNDYQIAYGHHRLIALREMMAPSEYVDIPVKDLDDATMLKIMAQENMEEWTTGPDIIDETVLAAKKFLEEHPSELKKYQTYKRSKPSAAGIAKFLGWNDTRVKSSMERIQSIETKVIDHDAVKSLRTEHEARDFVKAVKDNALPVSKQKEIAKRVKSGDVAKGAIRDAVIDAKIQSNNNVEEKQQQEFAEYVSETAKIASNLSDRLKRLIADKELLSVEVHTSILDKYLLVKVLMDISKSIKSLIKRANDGKSTPAEASPSQMELFNQEETAK